MITIKQIKTKETYPIRQLVLRKNKPIETCYFVGDDDDDTYHFGIFSDNILFGVASIYTVKNRQFKHERQFQLRGMAITENTQKLGLGSLLLKEIDDFCYKKNADLLWFNARESALKFYKKNKFEIIGNKFEIKNVGPHFVMCKLYN